MTLNYILYFYLAPTTENQETIVVVLGCIVTPLLDLQETGRQPAKKPWSSWRNLYSTTSAPLCLASPVSTSNQRQARYKFTSTTAHSPNDTL